MKKISLLIAGVLFSNGVLAAGATVAGAGTGTFPGGIIAAVVDVTQAKMEVNNHTTDVGNDITKQITKVGSSIQSEIQKASAVTKAQTEAQTVASAEGNKDAVKAQARIDSEVSNGPESMGSGACTADKGAESSGSIKNVTEAVKAKGRTVITTHTTSGASHNDTGTALRESLEKSEGGAMNLDPEGGTATKEQFQAGVEYIKTTIEPVPSPALPENVKGETAQRYKDLAEWRAQHLTWPNIILTDIQSRTAPAASNDAAKLIWTTAGFEGEPPHVEGEYSQDTYEQVLVDSRFRSAKWHGNKDETGIRSMSEKGLLIELVEMQAFMVEMMHENNKIQRYLAAITAEQRATEVQDSTTVPLNKLYRDALSGK